MFQCRHCPSQKFTKDAMKIHEDRVHGVQVIKTNLGMLKDLHSTTDMPKGSDMPVWIPVDYEESPKWCTISYWELTTRVGEMYEATGDRFIIDGFTNPLANIHRNRFSLGQLTNVSRNAMIENTLPHIGKGQYVFIIRIRFIIYSPWECQNHL